MSLGLKTLLVLTLLHVISSRWSTQKVYGGDLCSMDGVNVKHHVWEHPGEEADASDDRTHYHYEYNFQEHKHYVTLNYVQGEGEQGASYAGKMVHLPLNESSPGLTSEAQNFKFNLPEGATVEEHLEYGYEYIYHNHSHYVSAFDAYRLPWWEQPPWFTNTLKKTKDFHYSFEEFSDSVQQLLAPLTPEELKKHAAHGDATNVVREQGPFVSIPVKQADGSYALIKVPTNTEVLKNASTVLGDNSTHHRYVVNQQKHTWYIPRSEHKVDLHSNSISSAEKVSTYYKPKETVTSDKSRVVVHYHINQKVHLHNHMVYYVENKYFQPQLPSLTDPLDTKEIPVVVPGARPSGDSSNTKYMHKVHKENHPAGSQTHYRSFFANVFHQYNQQVYTSNGEIKNSVLPKQGVAASFSYDPVTQPKTNNHVTYVFGHVMHVHNHTVLLRSEAPPKEFLLLDNEGVSVQNLKVTVGEEISQSSWQVLDYIMLFTVLGFTAFGVRLMWNKKAQINMRDFKRI